MQHTTVTRIVMYGGAFLFGFLVVLGVGGEGVAMAEQVQGDVKLLKQCLQQEDATFYGANWCSHTDQQKQILDEAMSEVEYVECFDEGVMGTALLADKRTVCKDNDVEKYPTWVIEGDRYEDVLSRGELAQILGCTSEVL